MRIKSIKLWPFINYREKMTVNITEIHFINYINVKDKKISRFKVIDNTISDPESPLSISTDHSIKKCSLQGIGKFATDIIVKHFRKETNFENKRIMIIVDLTEFPILKTYIDTRDPQNLYSEPYDDFSHKVIQTYDTYDQKTHIPVIFINMNIGFTGLRLIPLVRINPPS